MLVSTVATHVINAKININVLPVLQETFYTHSFKMIKLPQISAKIHVHYLERMVTLPLEHALIVALAATTVTIAIAVACATHIPYLTLLISNVIAILSTIFIRHLMPRQC